MQEEYAQKIIKAADSRSEFVTDVDGFVYWYPLRDNGNLSAAQLRVLADELDKRNKRWQQDIDNYFESNASLTLTGKEHRKHEND